jgi:hypothetical protein
VMAVCAALLIAGGAISFIVLSNGNARGNPGGPAP